MEEETKGGRQTIRLKNYDYSQSGAYFVTLCTDGRRLLFGDIRDDQVMLNDLGLAIETEWLSTPEVRGYVELDMFVVMPNHIHGILVLNHSRRMPNLHQELGFRSPSATLGAIIRGFKAASTKIVNGLRGLPGSVLWQRGYHEHIIRSDRDLVAIREYIVNNPAKWSEDNDNPNRVRK